MGIWGKEEGGTRCSVESLHALWRVVCGVWCVLYRGWCGSTWCGLGHTAVPIIVSRMPAVLGAAAVSGVLRFIIVTSGPSVMVAISTHHAGRCVVVVCVSTMVALVAAGGGDAMSGATCAQVGGCGEQWWAYEAAAARRTLPCRRCLALALRMLLQETERGGGGGVVSCGSTQEQTAHAGLTE